MASFHCKCGNLLSNSQIPDDVTIWAYSDREWDEITNDITDIKDLPNPRNSVWCCPNCEAIYVFDEHNKLRKRYILDPDWIHDM